MTGLILPIKRIFSFIAIAVLAGCRQQGSEWVCKEAGVSFRLPNPSEWDQVPLPRDEGKLGLHQIDGNSSIAFIAFKRRPGEVMDQKFVDRFEGGMYKKPGLEKISGEFLTFKGREGYKILDKKRDDDATRTAILMWFEKDYLLEIAATTSDSDPLTNSTVREFIESIRFLPELTNEVTAAKSHP